MKTNLLHSLTIGLLLHSYSPASTCISSLSGVTKRNNGADIANGSVHRAFNTLADPSHGQAINPAKIAHRLKSTLSDRELAELGRRFHGILKIATTTTETSEAFPNTAFVNGFASDNLNHVSLIYRALEASERDLKDYFDLPLDVAMVNAAAHDLGKVSPMLRDEKLLTPEQRNIFRNIFPNVTGPQGFPGSDFLAGHILAHDTLSNLTIENVLNEVAKNKKWDASDTAEVIRLFQAASSGHNAGYEKNLSGNHFWHSTWPMYVKKMREAGFDVESTHYPRAEGGSVPAVMAMVDRMTSLHPSFVEKIAGQGGFEWSAKSVSGLLSGNAKAVRQEVDSIVKELDKHKKLPTQNVRDIALYKMMEQQVVAAEKLGENLTAMNDFDSAYEGRPGRATISDTAPFILYKKPDGVWMKVSDNGELSQWTNSAWKLVEIPAALKGKKAAVLMQLAIGYAPIDTTMPAVFQP